MGGPSNTATLSLPAAQEQSLPFAPSLPEVARHTAPRFQLKRGPLADRHDIWSLDISRGCAFRRVGPGPALQQVGPAPSDAGCLRSRRVQGRSELGAASLQQPPALGRARSVQPGLVQGCGGLAPGAGGVVLVPGERLEVAARRGGPGLGVGEGGLQRFDLSREGGRGGGGALVALVDDPRPPGSKRLVAVDALREALGG